MGEHLPCKQRVASSSLVDSTTRFGTHVGKCIQTHIRRIPVVCIPSGCLMKKQYGAVCIRFESLSKSF